MVVQFVTVHRLLTVSLPLHCPPAGRGPSRAPAQSCVSFPIAGHRVYVHTDDARQQQHHLTMPVCMSGAPGVTPDHDRPKPGLCVHDPPSHSTHTRRRACARRVIRVELSLVWSGVDRRAPGVDMLAVHACAVPQLCAAGVPKLMARVRTCASQCVCVCARALVNIDAIYGSTVCFV